MKLSNSNRSPISSQLSSLLKESLTIVQIKTIARKYDVHYNTIINIRDRRKKAPNKEIQKDMINMAIETQKNRIRNGKEFLERLNEELLKLM